MDTESILKQVNSLIQQYEYHGIKNTLYVDLTTLKTLISQNEQKALLFVFPYIYDLITLADNNLKELAK